MLKKRALHVASPFSFSFIIVSLLDLLSASSFYEPRPQPYPKDKASEYSDRRYKSLWFTSIPGNVTVFFSFLSRSC